jgi:hypothetical protein
MLAIQASLRCCNVRLRSGKHARICADGIAAYRHAAPYEKKLCVRLLTVEKSVFRFRQADVPCGIK